MKDEDKTKKQLLKELQGLKKKVSNLEASESKRREAEEALLESKEKYHQIISTSTDTIMVFDAKTKGFVKVNSAGEDLYGYSRKEFLNMNILDITSEEKETKQAFEKVLQDKLDHVPVRYHRKKDGTVFPVEISASQFDIRGQTFVCGVVRDITKRKQAEMLLQESEEKMRIMFESIRDGIVVIDLEANILEVNSAMLRMGKYSKKEELIGQNALDFVSPKDRKRAISNMNREINVGFSSGEIEYTLIAKDGIEFDAESSASLIRDRSGNPNGLVNVIRDITERKHAEKTLKESEERYKGIIQSTASCIAVYEPFNNGQNFIFVDFNPMAEKVEAIAKKEVIGKKVTEVFPGVKKFGLYKVFQNVWKTGKPEHHPISIYKDKRIQGYRENYIYKLSSGEIVAVYQDLTKRKFAEEERERLNEELMKKNKELEQIVYATSHDLRSPLVNIQGFGRELDYSIEELKVNLKTKEISENVKKNIFSILEEDIPESMKYIQNSISKMDLLLSGLLRLSRIGRYALNMEKLDMNKLISSVVYTFEFLIKEKDVKLHISRLPACKVDKSQINQVFSNLLDNAIKYLNPNRPGIIKISGYKKKDCSVYCVEDNGIGVFKKNHEKIFRIFYQTDSDKSSGEGIGLTIVNRIIDKHNGKVWVESEFGKGSKFYISLSCV